MKRISILLIAVLLLTLAVPTYAHPGSLDENGGHHNRSTGEYHYHHGHPAHQHPNGVCPYDFEDTTGKNSGAPSVGSGSKVPSVHFKASSGSSTHFIQRGNSSSDSAANNRQGFSSLKSMDFELYIELIGFLALLGVQFAIALSDKLKKRRFAKSSLPPSRPPTKNPDEPPPPPPEPPEKRPHRLDLSNRFDVIFGSRVVTLYGLPAVRISHVGYLRDSQQLFIRFRDDNSVLVYSDVPLAVCSEFVRSSFPDQYFAILIDRHFPTQRLV